MLSSNRSNKSSPSKLTTRLTQISLYLKNQEQLSFKRSLYRTYTSEIERRERNPSLKNITKIAQALEISLRDLFSF